MWVKIPPDKSNAVITSRRRRSVILGSMLCLSTFFFMLFGFHSYWLSSLTFGLLSVYFVLTLLDLAVIPFFEKEYRLKALASFGVTALFLVLLVPSAILGVEAARMKSKIKFETQKPQYEEFVQSIQKGEIIINEEMGVGMGNVEIPVKYETLAEAVYADRDADGVWTVRFFTGEGALRGSNFFYRGDDEPAKWTSYNKKLHYHKLESFWYQQY